MVGNKLGLKIAIETTVRIAEHLPNKDNKELYRKTVESIFDDQLKAYTNFNRQQRHDCRKFLKESMRQRDAD